MKRVLSIMMLTGALCAQDADEALRLAETLRNDYKNHIEQVHPGQFVPGFNENPSEAGINPDQLQALGEQHARTDVFTKDLIEQQKQTEQVPLDMNSAPMQETGRAIENADILTGNLESPCKDGSCVPTQDNPGEDFAEGVSQLGALTAESNEVMRGVRRRNRIFVFSGSNNTCRTVVAHLGSCCGGHARVLQCRPEERALAQAILDGRASKVGTFCAHKAGICFEEKESWCVFPSKLASIFQIQGRLGQLGIGFGWAGGKKNEADCRGLTPHELERIRIDQLDLSAVSKEFEARVRPKNAKDMESKARSRIEGMEGGGHA